MPDGEFGVLVLTSMTRTAMPILRYWTGDITRLLPAENATGRTMRRMDFIQGRSDDMIILRGVNVYPSQIEAVFAHFAELRPHYQLVLSRTGLMDELLLKVESERLDSVLGREVSGRIKAQIGVSVTCELCPDGTLAAQRGRQTQAGAGFAGSAVMPDLDRLPVPVSLAGFRGARGRPAGTDSFQPQDAQLGGRQHAPRAGEPLAGGGQ